MSRLTIGSEEQAASISVLLFTLFLSVLTRGQAALLQGTRRMKALASVTVYGARLGTTNSVSIFYFSQKRGIVPSLVANAIA